MNPTGVQNMEKRGHIMNDAARWRAERSTPRKCEYCGKEIEPAENVLKVEDGIWNSKIGVSQAMVFYLHYRCALPYFEENS